MITLWAAAMYLVRHAEKWWYSLMCAVPAAFMSGVSCTYILMAEERFRLSPGISYPVGALFIAACMSWYLIKLIRQNRKNRLSH